jgi:hypothetical protein
MSEFDRSSAIGTVVFAVIAAIGLLPALVTMLLMVELPNERWNGVHARLRLATLSGCCDPPIYFDSSTLFLRRRVQ